MERCTIRYRILGDEAETRARADDLRHEQTVELPADLLPPGFIPDEVVGQVEAIVPDGDACLIDVSFAADNVGGDLSQLLNTLFGNTSIKPDVRLERIVSLPAALSATLPGPRFGVAGLRERLGVSQRPLLCTALKPLGLDADALADLAYRFALGGIDIIKDDHGLADQRYAPWDERCRACAAAVARANNETGYSCVYAPHVIGSPEQVRARGERAAEYGAGALLVSPGLIGFPAMAALTERGLPLLAHPALLGAFTTHDSSGISHGALYGQLLALAGADGVIFPSWGGRFAYTREQCAEIAAACARPLGERPAIFPTPGGGMSLERIPEMLAVYGPDVIFLIGGGLLRHGPDLVTSCQAFKQALTPVS